MHILYAVLKICANFVPKFVLVDIEFINKNHNRGTLEFTNYYILLKFKMSERKDLFLNFVITELENRTNVNKVNIE